MSTASAGAWSLSTGLAHDRGSIARLPGTDSRSTPVREGERHECVILMPAWPSACRHCHEPVHRSAAAHRSHTQYAGVRGSDAIPLVHPGRHRRYLALPLQVAGRTHVATAGGGPLGGAVASPVVLADVGVAVRPVRGGRSAAFAVVAPRQAHTRLAAASGRGRYSDRLRLRHRVGRRRPWPGRRGESVPGRLDARAQSGDDAGRTGGRADGRLERWPAGPRAGTDLPPDAPPQCRLRRHARRGNLRAGADGFGWAAAGRSWWRTTCSWREPWQTCTAWRKRTHAGATWSLSFRPFHRRRFRPAPCTGTREASIATPPWSFSSPARATSSGLFPRRAWRRPETPSAGRRPGSSATAASGRATVPLEGASPTDRGGSRPLPGCRARRPPSEPGRR